MWPSLAQSLAGLGFNYWPQNLSVFHGLGTDDNIETSAAIDSWNDQDHGRILATSQSMLVFSGSSDADIVSGRSHTRRG